MLTQIFKESELHKAADLLKRGDVVAFPTETVYGLGAPIFNASAVRSIFRLKGRPQDNPLIAHIASLSDLDRIVAALPNAFHSLAEAFWPGPLTLILPAHPHVPKEATAGLSTLGVRMPAHPFALKLIELVGEPLVAPSANLSGSPSATCAEHVLDDFAGTLRGVVDGGECQEGIESTVLSLVDPNYPVIYRPGSVSKGEIERVLGKIVSMHTSATETPPSPGLKYRHYAPKARVILTRDKGDQKVNRHNLFHILRQADKEGLQEIVIGCDEEMLADEALMNRLSKAADHSSIIDKI